MWRSDLETQRCATTVSNRAPCLLLSTSSTTRIGIGRQYSRVDHPVNTKPSHHSLTCRCSVHSEYLCLLVAARSCLRHPHQCSRTILIHGVGNHKKCGQVNEHLLAEVFRGTVEQQYSPQSLRDSLQKRGMLLTLASNVNEQCQLLITEL